MIKDMKILVNGQEIEFPFDLKNFFNLRTPGQRRPRGFCFPQEPSRIFQEFGQPRIPRRPMRLVREEKQPGEQQVKTVWYNVDIRKDLETLNERITRLEELLIKKELKKPEKPKPKTKAAQKMEEKSKKGKAKKVKDSRIKKK